MSGPCRTAAAREIYRFHCKGAEEVAFGQNSGGCGSVFESALVSGGLIDCAYRSLTERNWVGHTTRVSIEIRDDFLFT